MPSQYGGIGLRQATSSTGGTCRFSCRCTTESASTRNERSGVARPACEIGAVEMVERRNGEQHPVFPGVYPREVHEGIALFFNVVDAGILLDGWRFPMEVVGIDPRKSVQVISIDGECTD